MEEIWKDIPEYEGYYQASNLGNVRSLKFWNNRYKKHYDRIIILKQTNMPTGYKQITLCKDMTRKNYCVHRLIAKTFLKNLNNYKAVNHIDYNKHNNKVENLEWCTYSQNELHSYAHGKITANSKSVKLFDKGIMIKEWTSISKSAKDLNISRKLASLYCHDKVINKKYDLRFNN
jgi:hypothetical protein